MAKVNSQVSRFDAKSTNRDEELAQTSAIVGKPAINFSDVVKTPAEGPAKIISIVNQKGGVGKTTTTINLGAALAELGRRVLLVDFDSQASMTIGLGIKPFENEQYNSIWYLLNDPAADIHDAILKSNVPGMDFIRGHEDMAAAEAKFVSEIAKEHKLRKMLAPVLDEYDVILIDCSPSLGTLTVNALTASDGVIVPLECEYFALRGVALLADIIGKVQENTNPNLKLTGILPTMFDRKTVHSKEVLERISEAYPAEVFDTIISRTVRFPETTVAGEPITTYASSSIGASSYRRLARELIAVGGCK